MGEAWWRSSYSLGACRPGPSSAPRRRTRPETPRSSPTASRYLPPPGLRAPGAAENPPTFRRPPGDATMTRFNPSVPFYYGLAFLFLVLLDLATAAGSGRAAASARAQAPRATNGQCGEPRTPSGPRPLDGGDCVHLNAAVYRSSCGTVTGVPTAVTPGSTLTVTVQAPGGGICGSGVQLSCSYAL